MKFIKHTEVPVLCGCGDDVSVSGYNRNLSYGSVEEGGDRICKCFQKATYTVNLEKFLIAG